MLTNRLLAEGDNARWFSNVLAHHLAPGGTAMEVGVIHNDAGRWKLLLGNWQ